MKKSSDMRKMIRHPDRFAPPSSERKRHKWKPIIAAFMEDRLDELRSIQRTGTRGRILSTLAASMLRTVGLSVRPEPVFNHVEPDPWYQDFAGRHGLKLRTDAIYNPDFLLDNGSWLEVTLSENTAYKKLLRYGHQTPCLTVIWLDEDTGLHKELCKAVDFPNAEVISLQRFFADLEDRPGGAGLVEKLKRLKALKGQIL